MADLSSLSNEDLLRLAGRSPQKSAQNDISSVSDEDLLAMLQQGNVEQKQPQMAPSPTEGGEMQSILGAILQGGAGVAAAKKGVMDFLSGAGKLGAKGIDYLAGTDLEGMVPEYEPSEIEKLLMKGSPKTAAVGEFAGGALPAMMLPGGQLKMAEGAISAAPEALQGALSLLGKGLKGAGVGAAVAPVYSPDEDILSSMKKGAEFGLGGVAAEKALGGLLKAGKLSGKLLGGTKSADEVKDVLSSADRLGLDMPLAEAIGSRGAAKFQKSGLKNVPLSGMTQQYSKLTNNLANHLHSIENELNPYNVHAGKETKKYFVDKYKNSMNEVGNIYEDLTSKISKVAPGDIHKSSGLLNEANKISSEFNEFKKLAGGDIKVPKSVHNFIKEVDKAPKNINSALRQDEIINERIGDARSKASLGDREGKRELRYFNRLKSANMDDIDTTIKNINSPEILEQWKNAKDYYKDNIVPFEKKGSVLGKIINPKTRSDEVQSIFLKKSGQQPKTEILKEVTDFLPQDIKDKIAHNQLVGPKDKNVLGMIDEFEKLQPGQRKELFSKDVHQKLSDILKIKKHIGKSEFNQMFVADTGSKAMHAGIPFALFQAGNTIGGPLAGAATLAGGIGAGRLSQKAIMSDLLKKMHSRAISGGKVKTPNISKLAYLGLPINGSEDK